MCPIAVTLYSKQTTHTVIVQSNVLRKPRSFNYNHNVTKIELIIIETDSTLAIWIEAWDDKSSLVFGSKK